MKITASVGEGAVTGKMTTPDEWVAAAGKALLTVVKEVAGEIEGKGRADIGQAGNFGNWEQDFHVTADGDGGDIKLEATMQHPFWQVFQFGAVIQGRPLLYFKPTKAVGGLEGKPLPSLISKHSVSIPKKFHLIEIAAEGAEKVGPLFHQALRDAKSSLAGG